MYDPYVAIIVPVYKPRREYSPGIVGEDIRRDLALVCEEQVIFEVRVSRKAQTAGNNSLQKVVRHGTVSNLAAERFLMEE